jgi:hypothetical protein
MLYSLCMFLKALLFFYVSTSIIQTPHYQVSAQDLPEFYERVLKAQLHCIVYPPGRSSLGGFISVWNQLTPEWDCIKDQYEACNFPDARTGASNFFMSSRGNRSMSFGFTGLSYHRDPTTFVQKPAMRVGTRHWGKHMKALSSLQEACGAHPPVDARRFQDFGNTIVEQNFLEGYTVAVTTLLTENVACHLDTQNDSSTGFTTVIVASEVKDGERVIQGGYFKGCSSAYYCREVLTTQAIARARTLLGEILDWEFHRSVSRRQQCPAPGALSPKTPACIDKAVRLSPFVHILVELIRMFSLSFEKTLEALLPVTLVPASVYWRVGCQWIDSKKLPDQNLTLAFLETCRPSLPSISTKRIEWSLRKLGNDINCVNKKRTNRHSYEKLVSDLQTISVPGATDPVLAIEDLVTVGALSGVIHHPILADQAYLYGSTPTLVAIKTAFRCATISQARGLVLSVSCALKISPATAHVLFRQMLHLEKIYSDFKGSIVFGAGAHGVTSNILMVDASDVEEGSLLEPTILRVTKDIRNVRRSIKPHTLLAMSTRSSTFKRPLPEVVLNSVIPWAEVVLLRDASEQVCIHPILDGGHITYIKELHPPGSRVCWRAICRVNGVTWNPNDAHVAAWGPSNVSSKFGGLAHFCCRPEGGGGLVYNSKKKAMESLLVYMTVFGGGPSFEWVRHSLGPHPFVCVRKRNNTKSVDPLFLIYRHKGNICIGHYKDRWRTLTKLCRD